MAAVVLRVKHSRRPYLNLADRIVIKDNGRLSVNVTVRRFDPAFVDYVEPLRQAGKKRIRRVWRDSRKSGPRDIAAC